MQAPNQLVRIALDLGVEYDDANNAPLNLYDFALKEGDAMHGIHGAIVSGNTFRVLEVQPCQSR